MTCWWCKKETAEGVWICEECKLPCPKCKKPVTSQLKWENKEMAITRCDPCDLWVDYYPIPKRAQ